MELRTVAYLANLLRSFANKKSHLSGKVLHGHIVRTGIFTDTYLSNRLIDLYVECNNHVYARNVFGTMPMKDGYSWNAMLSFCCKAGNLREAYHLFDEMPERSTISWNNMISGFVRSGLEEKGLDFCAKMISEGFIPTRFTLASVLSACSVLLNVGYGRSCHGTAVKIGLEMNIFVGNALLGMYSKCGVVLDALRVFEDMPEHNEVTLTTMIGELAQENQVLEAFQMFRSMLEKRVQIDSVCLSNILAVCARKFDLFDDKGQTSDNMHGKQIHCLSFKLGFVRDLHLNNSLLDLYAKGGDMDSAEMIFAYMTERSVVSWNIMMAGYGQKRQSHKSVEYLERMRYSGSHPNEVTYVNVLRACVKSEDIGTGRRFFDTISSPSVSSWNAMLSGYSQCENHEEATKLFREMQFQNVTPDRTTLAIVLSSCAGKGFLEGGRQVHALSLKACLHIDKYVASGLIGLYSECGNIDIAECIFYRIPELDTVCWNSMIAGFSVNSLEKEAFVFFKKMRRDGHFPTEASYATILGCCAKLSSLFQGQLIHTQIVKDGYIDDVFVGTALINMYCKCGDVDAAEKFFNMMHMKNTVTWNEMIHGYAQSGCGEEAISVYRDMISSGETPDPITFVSVLAACSHSGLIDFLIEIFDSMQRDYGVVPNLDHYICVLDCLCRAGRFREAEFLVEKTPYKNEPIMWEVLLSSYRINGNMSLAKRAAEKLFYLNPRNSNPYVHLANAYASVEQWDAAGAVRGLMNGNNVLKDPGFSWVENNDNANLDVTENYNLRRVWS